MKHRLIYLLLFSFPAASAFAQQHKPDFYKADRHALLTKGENISVLAGELTRPFAAESEKVRAIFRWITDNIAYKTRTNDKTHYRKKYGIVPIGGIDSSELISLDESVAEHTIQNGEAYCEGYARLFKALCDKAGIQSLLVVGYGDTGEGTGRHKFRTNHTWNAVRADSNWYLLDVTWSSGFFYRNNPAFVKNFSDQYFFTSPGQFIKDHEPDDIRWALLSPASMPAAWGYRHSPYRTRSSVKYDVRSALPSKGIIDALPGDTLRFEVQLDPVRMNMLIATDSLWEEKELLALPYCSFLDPSQLDFKTGILIYQYIVQNNTNDWLHLMYNKDAILRYRIRVKGEMAKQ